MASFLLSIVLGVAFAAPAASSVVPPVACGMPQFLGVTPPTRVERPLGPPPPDGEKALRDAFGVVDNELLTENFVFRWGTSGSVRTADVERLAAAFEAAWTEEISVQGHPLPTGADTYRFNVYIGDSGGGTPSGSGAAGYFWYDEEGWPMVVVAADTLRDGAYADITAAHEFYHAIQGGTDRYPYSGDSAWFWEASATWASATVYPDNLNYATFLFGYVLLPHYPINYFNYPDSWRVEDYYQYGAFIVPLHVSELTADRSLIREIWTRDDAARDPLTTMDRLLEERGIAFDDVFMDHVARMATFDYPNGTAMERMVEANAGRYDEYENLVAATVGPEGTDGWVDGPNNLRPYRYGYNAIRIDPGDSAFVTISIEGDLDGDAGHSAKWGAQLVRKHGGARTYVPLTFEGQNARLDIDDLDGEELWLVIGAWTSISSTFDSERFGYRYNVAYSLDVDEPVVDEPVGEDSGGAVAFGTTSGEAPAKSGCAVGALSGLGMLFWVPLLGVWVRRR